jgi:hypothetical protein
LNTRRASGSHAPRTKGENIKSREFQYWCGIEKIPQRCLRTAGELQSIYQRQGSPFDHVIQRVFLFLFQRHEPTINLRGFEQWPHALSGDDLSSYTYNVVNGLYACTIEYYRYLRMIKDYNRTQTHAPYDP